METEPEPRTAQRWLGVAESLAFLLACLATALAVGGVQLILLAPTTHAIEFRLYERERAGAPAADPRELVERVEALGLPGTVASATRRGQPTLVVSGLDSIEMPRAAVGELLMESGYLPIDPDVRSGPDPRVLLRDYPALTLGLQAGVLIVFGVGLARLRVRRGAPAASSRVALGIGAVAGLAGFLVALLVSAIQHVLGWSVHEQAWLLELLRDRQTFLTILPFVVVLMPVSEETLFRGYLFRFLLQRGGTRTAYLVSAAAFSAVHLHLPGLPTYFIVGLLFAYVCRRTGTLIAPMAGHVTYNGLALGFTMLGPGGI